MSDPPNKCFFVDYAGTMPVMPPRFHWMLIVVRLQSITLLRLVPSMGLKVSLMNRKVNYKKRNNKLHIIYYLITQLKICLIYSK